MVMVDDDYKNDDNYDHDWWWRLMMTMIERKTFLTWVINIILCSWFKNRRIGSLICLTFLGDMLRVAVAESARNKEYYIKKHKRLEVAQVRPIANDKRLKVEIAIEGWNYSWSYKVAFKYFIIPKNTGKYFTEILGKCFQLSLCSSFQQNRFNQIPDVNIKSFGVQKRFTN